MSFDAIDRWQNIVAQGETELGQAYVGRTAVWGVCDRHILPIFTNVQYKYHIAE